MKASRILAAAALLAWTVPAAGAPARASRPTRAHPTCPEGQAATLTGHPFLPWRCLGPGEELDPPPPAAPAPSTATAAAAKAPPKGKTDKARSTPKDLTGRWEGLLVYGPERFEILWEVRASKGGWLVSFGMKDYYSHGKQTYQAELRPGKRPGVFSAEVELPPYADRLKATVLFAPNPDGADFDRRVELTYDGRPVRHAILLTRDGKDRIRFAYEDPALEGRRIEGELTRTQRESL